MEINVRADRKLVEIWLTNAEKRDGALLEKLKTLYPVYRAEKYLVVVFASGGRALSDATSDLLCYNRRRLAQTEARRRP